MIMKGSNKYVASDGWRWTPRRKVEVLDRVASGTISDVELAFLGISREELAEWQKLHNINGRKALRTTRLQIYRGS